MEAPTLAALNAEDLTRWRMVVAQQKAMEVKPDAYSRQEIEQAYLLHMRLWGEFIQKYDVPDDSNLTISCNNGRIFVGD